MKKMIKFAMAATAVVAISDAALARNDRAVFPIAAALKSGAIDRGTPIHFGSTGGQALGPLKVSVKVSVGSQPQDACNRAFADAIGQLQSKAQQLGGNAVGSIASIHGRSQMTGGSEFLCGIGSVQTNVVLQGMAVRRR